MDKFIYLTLYAHMKAPAEVKTGQVLNGSQVVGYNGATGNATGDHLHFQVIDYINHDNYIDNFDGYKSPYVWPLNPKVVIDRYGEPSPNDITLDFGVTSAPYSVSWPHQGVDYSGIEDQSYEVDQVFSLAGAKSEVLQTGWHYDFGNYAILGIIGPADKDEEDVMNLRYGTVERIEMIKSGGYLASVEMVDGKFTNQYVQLGSARYKVGAQFTTVMVRTCQKAEEGDNRVRLIIEGPHAGAYIYSRYSGTNKAKVIK